MPRRRKSAATAWWWTVGTTTHGGVDQRQQRPVVGEGPRAAALGDGLGLGRVDVGDADQLHVGQPGQDAGVLLAEVADADHRQPQTCHASFLAFVSSPLRPVGAAERDAAPASRSASGPTPPARAKPPRQRGGRCPLSARTSSTLSGWPER